MRTSIILFLLINYAVSFSQEKQVELHVIDSRGDTLYGSLVHGNEIISDSNNHCVLIIAGSGPTDRDGNNMGFKNNSLRQIATFLEKKQIPSFRYDKRGIGKSANALIPESELRFEQNVDDAQLFVEMLKKRGYNSFTVLGHSQGSLVATLLAQRDSSITSLISVAGPGRNIADVLKEQYKATSKEVSDSANVVIDLLKGGETIDQLAPWLFTVFRPSIQGYMHSWMRYDPAVEFNKLEIRKFVIQGTTDLQVKETDAEILSDSKDTELFIIEDMNHVLKYSSNDLDENKATYVNPKLPLHIQFTQTLSIILRKI